jgi:hypothetical protein
MKIAKQKIYSVLFSVLVLASAVFFLTRESESNENSLSFYTDSRMVEGEMIVMLKEGVNINDFLASYDNIGLRVKEELYKDYNLWLLEYDVNRSAPVNALISVMGSRDVSVAQFNHSVDLRAATPNDTRFAEQWDMNNTGQSGGTADADIDAPEAWNITTGGVTSQGDSIVVAVIDGGFFLAHNDVSFWKNYAEIPSNSIDDDSNGYVDDVNGWNAYNNNGTITSAQHGTHVSGTVGARGNNNLGVTGVNWNVKVMAIQGSSSTEATVIKAYGYALKQRKIYNQTNGQKGAFVVSTNSSFGVDFGNPAAYPLWCAFYDSLGKAGVLSAGAGPNQNVNIDVVGDIPTTCPSNYMIAVTNTTNTDQRNSGAGWGPLNMDLGAPGTNILSTNPNNLYGTSTGTSMATPHVAGAVGLMYAAANPHIIALSKTNPDSAALLIKKLMLSSVDSITSMQTTVLSKGRLNLHKSVLAVGGPLTGVTNTTQVMGFRLSQNYPNPFNPATKINYSLPKQGFVSLKVFDIAGKEVATLVSGVKQAGEYNIDFNASELTSGIYFYTIKAGDFLETRKMLLIK